MRISHSTPAWLLLASALVGYAHAAAPSLTGAEQKRAVVLRRERADQYQVKQAEHAILAAALRAKTLTAEEISLNAALRQTENRTADISAHLAILDQAMTQANAKRARAVAALRPLIPIMLRLAAHPTGSLLGSGQSMTASVRGALVMRGLTRLISTRTADLHRIIVSDRALRQQVALQQTQLQTALAQQTAARDRLQSAIILAQAAQQRAGRRKLLAAQAQAADAARAHSLNGVIARLRAVQRAAAAHEASARIRPFASAPPSTPADLAGAPVAGRLVRQFGAQTMAGPALGDTFATAPEAMVSASCAGRVAFARRFQSYGKLLILSCADGNDFVIAGVDRFIVHVGQKIVPGQPIAAMAARGRNGGGAPKLYVELRQNGTPVNPALGFAAPAQATP